MFRLKFAMVVLGGVLAWWGVQEYRVSNKATDEPIAVDLAQIEAGTIPDNNHWKLGEHFAIYNASVYEYEQDRGATGEPGQTARVNHCYYPVVSREHPLIQGLAELIAQYGDLENVPEDQLPPLSDFAVVVKTKQFATIGAIPAEWDMHDSLTGLVINQIGTLDAEEAAMYRQNFPSLDTDKLIVLEAGRAPASGLKSGGMIAGGLAVSLAGLVWFIAGRSRA
ncbi:MAG: hypothetical protein KF847_03180 [Pirellulales bacterium]|nr:hypothetical protein [Pirellulales bacterium]